MDQTIIDYIVIISTVLFALFLFITNIKSMTENFVVDCSNARDGVSGCRDCCNNNQPNTYHKCVDNCMKN
jgi:hypothetical protein